MAAPPAPCNLPVNDVSPLWGKSYVEMGMEGHAQHRSQGTPAFFGNAFFRRPIYLVKEDEKGPAGSFDEKLLAEPLTSLAARFPSLQQMLAPALASADQNLAAAAKSALDLDRACRGKFISRCGKRNRLAARANSKSSPATKKNPRYGSSTTRKEPALISPSRTTSQFRSKRAPTATNS